MGSPITRQTVDRGQAERPATLAEPPPALTAQDVAGPKSEVLRETYVLHTAPDGSTVATEPTRPVHANPGPPSA